MKTLQLPLEIWGIVCEQLADEHFRQPGNPTSMSTDNPAGRRETLLALCLVSKGVAQMAQRVLFRTYDFGEGLNDGKKHLRFLRSLLDNARLAAAVRVVMLDHWICDIEPHRDELVAVYGRVAARLGFDAAAFPVALDFEENEHGLATRVPAIMQLLLPLLPNLRYLSVTTRHEEDALKLLSDLREAGVLQPFASVERLTLRHGDTEMGFALLDCAPLLTLTPNATTLHLMQCRGVGGSEDGDGGSTDTDSEDQKAAVLTNALRRCMPARIKTLDLDYCNLEHRDLRALLASCPRLERFSYYSGGAIVDEANREVGNRQLVASLAPAKATLRRVELNFEHSCREMSDDDDDDEDGYDDDEDGDGYGLTQASFAEFPVLSRVMYSGKVIFSNRARPSGIDNESEDEDDNNGDGEDSDEE
ncbi:F-box-like domain-containing protein [Apiospora marii]|uniref:F-box-like domain-containing protein n=1 Tax=Apiospora marii TaxID=335849 RepID=A0ABR1R1I0_9PEZI